MRNRKVREATPDVDRQVADLRHLLALMTGAKPAEALAALCAVLPPPAGEPADDFRPVRSVP